MNRCIRCDYKRLLQLKWPDPEPCDAFESLKVQQVENFHSMIPQTMKRKRLIQGRGLLSLPLGPKYCGWLLGMIFLILAAIGTRYTAGLLAKCLDVDHSLISFSDIAMEGF